jgi:hypothetical protein
VFPKSFENRVPTFIISKRFFLLDLLEPVYSFQILLDNKYF